MSDLATQYDDGVFEPDEETLMSALRNQDDIPILMDIVTDKMDADKPSFSASQEEHLANSFDDTIADDDRQDKGVSGGDQQETPLDDSLEHSLDDVVTLDNVVPDSALSQELIAKTIADVLEKRLPELVSEVMKALQAAEISQNSNTTQKE